MHEYQYIDTLNGHTQFQVDGFGFLQIMIFTNTRPFKLHRIVRGAYSPLINSPEMIHPFIIVSIPISYKLILH